jgi:hypothetical protein
MAGADRRAASIRHTCLGMAGPAILAAVDLILDAFWTEHVVCVASLPAVLRGFCPPGNEATLKPSGSTISVDQTRVSERRLIRNSCRRDRSWADGL